MIYTTLKYIALREYAKRLTPIVNDKLQMLLDEAIFKMLDYGISSIINTDNGLQVSKSKCLLSSDLTPLDEDVKAVFTTHWDFKPLCDREAISLSNAYYALTEHMNLEVSTHGHLLRYINNVAQVRLRESNRWVATAPKTWKGEELLTITKDADNQTASLSQLNQTSATPFTDALKEILAQFEAIVPLPQGIGSGDGQRFEQNIHIMRKKIDLCMTHLSDNINAVDFNGYYDPPAVGLGADSATADGILKQAQAQKILGSDTNTTNEDKEEVEQPNG